MTICKGKRYIKPTCDKCVELPYCKPTEKTKFKKAQQVYNKFLFDSHIKTLREVELQEKRLAAVEQGNTEQPRATHNARLEKLEKLTSALNQCNEAKNVTNDAYMKRLDALEKRVEDRSDDYHSHIGQLVTENEQEHESLVGTLQQHSEDIFNLGKDVKEHHAKIYRLETHIDVMESNARVATECSNKQAHAIEALQTEIHFIKERLGRCQDSVAELDPLGCVTVRKRGRPPKTKL